MTYGEIVKAAKRGVRWACSIDGAEAVDPVHIDARGIGGRRRKKADDPAYPGCRACHSAEHHLGELRTREAGDSLEFIATGATAARLGVREGVWTVAPFHGRELDEIG